MDDIKDKLNEAKYFLAQMSKMNRDKNPFRYNLSAFLAASCSLVSFIEDSNHLKQKAGFRIWINKEKSQWEKDEIWKFLKKQRNVAIHKRIVSTRTYQNQMDIPEIDLTQLQAFSLTAKINEDGIMENPHMIRVTREGTVLEEDVTATTKWIFDDLPKNRNLLDKDVLLICQEHIENLEAIVEECEKTFM